MFSQSSYRSVFSVFCLIVLLASPMPLRVHAAGQPTKGADIVFLIDQSDSMLDSDPLGLRFEGSQYAIEWLGRTLLEYDAAHQYSFRVAIIDFGETIRPVLDPIEIAPASEDNWKDTSGFIQKKLTPAARGSLGLTDPLLAFQRAAEIFAKWGPVTADRQRITILLTDGLPMPDSEAAMRKIEEVYPAAFPYPAYQLYVIGLSSGESPWSSWSARWNVLSHDQAQTVGNRRLLGTHFQRILGQVGQSMGIQTEQVTQCGMVAVAPYLDLVRVTVHNPDPTSAVKLFDASDKLLNGAITNGVVRVGDQVVEVRGHQTAIEAITVYDPAPGNWRVECPASGEGQPMLFVRQVSAHSQVDMPGQRLALGVPYAITFRLFDHSGKPLAQAKDPRYALDVRLSAAAAGQTGAKPEDVILRFDSTTQSFQGTLMPAVAGDWIYRLVARTATPDGGDRIVADLTTTAVRVSRPQVAISLPSGRLGQLQPISLTLTLADSERKPFVRTTEILKALGAEAIVEAASQTITVPLISTDSGLYVGTFVPLASGDHSVRGRLSLFDATLKKPIIVADGPTITRFTVQPLELKPRLEPAQLTQLVPATIHLSMPADRTDALASFRDLSLWIAQLKGLGSPNTEVSKAVTTDNELTVGFTPKMTGSFQPELAFALMRQGGGGDPAGTINQVLGAVSILPLQVITATEDSGAEHVKTCVLSVELLDATGRPFAKTMDQRYTLTVTAGDSATAKDARMPLQLGDDGVFRSTATPRNGGMYLLNVVAQRYNERIQLVDDTPLRSPICGVVKWSVVPNRTWIVPLLAIAALLILAILLGIVLMIRRRSKQPVTDEASSREAWGWVVLEHPKGSVAAKYDLSEKGLALQTWDPVEVTKDGKPVICPIGKVEIIQDVKESQGEGRAGQVGAHVRVIYQDQFDAFGTSRWVDEGIALELKDRWWITFRRPEKPSLTIGVAPSGVNETSASGESSIPPVVVKAEFGAVPSEAKPTGETTLGALNGQEFIQPSSDDWLFDSARPVPMISPRDEICDDIADVHEQS